MVKSIRKRINNLFYWSTISCYLLLTSSCAIQKAQHDLLAAAPLKGAHIGIGIYNDSKNQWIAKYQSDHYFTPASNTKILATYVGLAYLGDSIPGWKIAENTDTLFLFPQGDPSFLHPEFSYQPIANLIRATNKQVMIALENKADNFDAFGNGWAWNDYSEDYQPERARMPLYGNVVHFYDNKTALNIKPSYFMEGNRFDYNQVKGKIWSRNKNDNHFFTTQQVNNDKYFQVPFSYKATEVLAALNDSLQFNRKIGALEYQPTITSRLVKTIPTDTLLKIMMSRSDNFYAEQILLMASAQLLGKIDDAAIIDTVISSEFSDLPQKMKWADGSGLSRYNLNTPENYIAILKKMHSRFGENRVRSIFEKGGEGTLSSYYKNFPGELYAKTGTLGGQVALSGFIFTQKKQKLYFSVLVANHISKTTTPVRKAVEKYLIEVAKRN